MKTTISKQMPPHRDSVLVFDLDGTLFDEFSFVFQGFEHIADYLAPLIPPKECYEELCSLVQTSRATEEKLPWIQNTH